MQMTLRSWVLLITLSILWGGAFFFSAIAVQEIPPMTLVFLRTSLAAVTLYIYLKVRGTDLPKSREVWAALLLLGLINNAIPFSLLNWAQTQIPSGLASIGNATTPIFTVIIAHFWLTDERFALNKTIGVILGFIGVGILFSGTDLSGQDLSAYAIIATLGAGIAYGFGATFARRFKAINVKPSVVAFGQVTGGAICILPFAVIIERPWMIALPGMDAIIATLLLATVSSAFAYLIYFKLIEDAGAVNVALVTILVPLSAILLGAVFLNEELILQHYLGMICIFIGLLALDGRLIRYFKRGSS